MSNPRVTIIHKPSAFALKTHVNSSQAWLALVMLLVTAAALTPLTSRAANTPSNPTQLSIPLLIKAQQAPNPENYTRAYQFLNQTTMGATPKAAAELAKTVSNPTGLENWIDQQVAIEPSLLIPYIIEGILAPDFVSNHPISPDAPDFVYNDDKQLYRLYGWLEHAIYGQDQLRQRVTWALSQIFVVSDKDALFEEVESVADFYDTLARNAFGNYRKLLEAVTLHPAMGVYLSMLGNQREQEGTNIQPDENYAREVLQLFSIGQVLLNEDGSVQLNNNGDPIPTYNQDTISGFARVFTGWSYTCVWSYCGEMTIANASPSISNDFEHLRGWGTDYISNLTQSMVLYPEAHENGSKKLLAYPGVSRPDGIVPAGLGGQADLEEALDNIFYHPNVPPFVSKALIQKLVTSNPSPSYIHRVAQVFKDDGKGERGNLVAVLKAILLDQEARESANGDKSGKLKEPLLRVLHLWRAYDAFVPDGKVSTSSFCCPVYGDSPVHIFGQSPNQSMSVFNFFAPDYVPPGGLFTDGDVGPELQIATENFHIQMGWFFNVQSMWRTSEHIGNHGNDVFYINIEDDLAVAHDDELLVDHIGRKLLGSKDLISPVLRQETYNMLKLAPDVNIGSPHERFARQARVSEALFMFLLSPEFATQR
jgi:uncharacterized protein (DUF1800 family)